MGCYFNIILVRNRDNKVMELIKYIIFDINSYRVLYLGVNYVYFFVIIKLNFILVIYEELSFFVNNYFIIFDEKFYFNCFIGISNFLFNDLYYNIIECNSLFIVEEIYESFKKFISKLFENLFYNIYINKLGILKDFYLLKLFFLKENFVVIFYEDFNILMDDFYFKKDK